MAKGTRAIANARYEYPHSSNVNPSTELMRMPLFLRYEYPHSSNVNPPTELMRMPKDDTGISGGTVKKICSGAEVTARIEKVLLNLRTFGPSSLRYSTSTSPIFQVKGTEEDNKINYHHVKNVDEDDEDMSREVNGEEEDVDDGMCEVLLSEDELVNFF